MGEWMPLGAGYVRYLEKYPLSGFVLHAWFVKLDLHIGALYLFERLYREIRSRRMTVITKVIRHPYGTMDATGCWIRQVLGEIPTVRLCTSCLVCETGSPWRLLFERLYREIRSRRMTVITKVIRHPYGTIPCFHECR
jgi:hypothetical protein